MISLFRSRLLRLHVLNVDKMVHRPAAIAAIKKRTAPRGWQWQAKLLPLVLLPLIVAALGALTLGKLYLRRASSWGHVNGKMENGKRFSPVMPVTSWHQAYFRLFHGQIKIKRLHTYMVSFARYGWCCITLHGSSNTLALRWKVSKFMQNVH